MTQPVIFGRGDGAARDSSMLSRTGSGGRPGSRPGSRPGDKRFAVVFFAMLLLVLVGGYVAAYYFTSDRVPRSSEVAGVAIGGLRPAAAQDKLVEELGPRAESPLTLTATDVEGKDRQLDPGAAGLSFDAEATVDQAGGGRSLNPLRMLEVLTGGQTIQPVIEVDEPALESALSEVAADVDQEPVEGGIAFPAGDPEPTYPQPGIELDTTAAAERVRAALLAEDRTVELPVETVRAAVRPEDIDDAMTDFAQPAMSAPVTVTVQGEQTDIAPRVFAPALSMRVVDGALEPQLDAETLRKRVAKPLRRLAEPARDASVELRNGEPTVAPGRTGTEIDTRPLADALLPVLTAEGNDRAIELEATVARPALTTEEARNLGITEVVSSFTTSFPHSDYRNTNLGRAAEKINGTVLRPDDIFSLNGIVGERTAANGFAKGFIISDGALVEDFGGGVSQVATTVYNAAFFAGLKDVEHRPHSFYIDRYPMGREATVVWGALDLKFQNDTPHGVLVEAWIKPSSPGAQGEMNVRLWSTQYWDDIEAGLGEQHNFTDPETRYDESDSCYAQTGHAGFDVDVFRYFVRDGERVDTEEWNVTYNSAPNVLCSAPPSDAPESAGPADGG